MTILQFEPNARVLTSWGWLWLGPDGTYITHNAAHAAELRALGFVEANEYRAIAAPALDEVRAVLDTPGTEDTEGAAILRRDDLPRRRGRPRRS